jgi:hypothetical protein
MQSKIRLCMILLLAAAVLGACGSDVSGPDPDPDPDPSPVSDTLPVLGHGVIDARYTSEVAVRGTWAYTSTWGNRGAPGNAVFVWNVAGAIPILTDSLIIDNASTTGDVQISDDGSLLVVATEYSPGSIRIFDRSTPSAPTWVSTFASANTFSGVHTVKLGRFDGRHYAFLSINPGALPARLVIVDITDPAQPVEVMSRNMGNPYVHDVFVRDGILFTALWHDGVTIWDIGGGGMGGTPADPVLISNYVPVSGWIHNVWWFHDPHAQENRYLFLGEEGPGSVNSRTASGDIHVLDISDPTAPEQVAMYSLPGAGTHNFWMDEASGVLYAAYYNGGVRAIDVRGDLGTCTAAQRSPKGPCDLRLMGREIGVSLLGTTFIWGVVHQGTHLYASDMLSGLYKIDASALAR